MALNQQLQLVQLVEAVGLRSVWKTLRKAEDLPISERLDWGKLSWYFWGRFLFFLILVFYLFSFSFLRLQNWPKEMVLFSVSSSFNGSGPLTGQSFTVLQLEIGVDFPCDSSVLKASPPLQATAHAPEATWLPVRGIRLPVENDARLLWIFSSKRPETSWNLETSHSLKTHLFWRKRLPNFSHLSPSPHMTHMSTVFRMLNCFKLHPTSKQTLLLQGFRGLQPSTFECGVLSFRWQWGRWNGWDRKLGTMCIFSWLHV